MSSELMHTYDEGTTIGSEERARIRNRARARTDGPTQRTVRLLDALEAAERERDEARVFIDSVEFLFEKLVQDAEGHPLKVAGISQALCKEFLKNTRAALGKGGR